MDSIRLKKDGEPLLLTDSLLVAAYNDAREGIIGGSIKSTITMGIVNIANKDRFVHVIISDRLEDSTAIETHLMHIKNRIKCEANMADKQRVLNLINQYLDEQ